MELKEIAAISGKGGLFRVLKPTRSGVIVESMDDSKNKIVAGTNYRISILKEISVYTTSQEGSIPLEEVLFRIKEEFGDDPGVNSSSDGEELRAFIKHIVPEYDEERVYPSDIKKIVSWYSTLLKQAPEVLEKAKEETEKESPKKETPKEEVSSEEKKEKPKAKKASPKKSKEKELVGAEPKASSSKKSNR